jgi:hypothetical protein
MPQFANGGHRLPRNATMQRPAGAGGLVQWAEAETHGESFIPHAPSKRARSLEIWKRTGQILGALPMANGGMTGGVAAAGAPSLEVRVYVGNREITDIVRTELHERDRAIGAGRR